MSVEDVTHRLMIENAEQCGKFAGVIDCAIIALTHNDVARALKLLREVQEAYDTKRDADIARIEANLHAPVI
jgi:hypothetical protein